MGAVGAMEAARSRKQQLVAGCALALLVAFLVWTRCSGEGRQCLGGSQVFGAGSPDKELQNTFETVYSAGTWGSDGNGSGSGSTLNATVTIRKILYEAISSLGVQSMIDVPCGGMLWMPFLLEEVEKDFRYLGLDITHTVVEKNKRIFRQKKNWRFGTFDLTSQVLPKGYDLVHTRDALQHLSCKSVVAALRTISNSGAKYLMVGSYNSTANRDIKSGDYWDINLRIPPYSLPRPLATFAEGDAPGPRKYMLLYSIAQLQEQDFAAMSLRCALPAACIHPDC